MDTVIKNTVSSLKNLLSYAKEISKDYIMDIVLEFFNDNGEPYLSVGNFNTVELICTEIAIAYDNFHITYDISHVKQLKEDIYEGYDRLKEYINHVHFSNCVTRYPNHSLYGDKHPPFNIEKGDFSDSDMILFLEHLEKSGKIDDIDIISYEVISQNRETSESHYKSIKNSAKKVFLS
jgi:sugar phosphate isomerase/epimerase